MVCARCNRTLDVLDQETVETKAALMFFLVGAVTENAMFNGRTASEALTGARIALGWTEEQLAALMAQQ